MKAKQSKQPRQRAIPQRTCIACRGQEGKRALVRVVRGVHGVAVDVTGKASGRGAYLHPARSCWESALATRAIQRALRTALTPEESDRLREFAQTLPVSEVENNPVADVTILADQ